MKTTIEVEITNLNIDRHDYSFDYSITINGKHKSSGEYNSGHVWHSDIKGLKEVLKAGEAVKLALESFWLNNIGNYNNS
jgi:hypothetical protein